MSSGWSCDADIRARQYLSLSTSSLCSRFVLRRLEWIHTALVLRHCNRFSNQLLPSEYWIIEKRYLLALMEETVNIWLAPGI